MKALRGISRHVERTSRDVESQDTSFMSEESGPEQQLINFMRAMCAWESDLIEQHRVSDGTYLNSAENKAGARERLLRIYDAFLTRKERPTGRVASLDFGTPLAFDPERERVVDVVIQSNGSKAAIETLYRRPTRSFAAATRSSTHAKGGASTSPNAIRISDPSG